MNLHSLPQLVNIIDDIFPDEDDGYFNEDESFELYETCKFLMEEFIRTNSKIITEPEFEDIFNENIDELVKAQFDSDIFYNDDVEDELEDIIAEAKIDFFKDFMPPRSYPSSIILREPNIKLLSKQIDILRNKPQPVQRTKEWYEFRHNLITASNAYKAFDSQAYKNQLIYEKCQPLNPSNYISEDTNDKIEVNDDENIKHIHIKQPSQNPVQMVNINTTLHWGQKYEPLSVLIYEDMYKTKIEDFGCIKHEKYDFLGASPDGINVDTESPRYGRMLEIKNIVNREIDGIPKKEYWIQMQLQMEVCNLDECDFLETKFTEYDSAEAYWDNLVESNDNNNNTVKKGVIMYFHTKEGKPFYKYMPFHIETFEEVSEWQEQMVDLYQSTEYNYVWIKDYYWKLDYLSCVLVCRNRQWFQDNIHELSELWNIVKKERVSGFEHRAPNRKTKIDNAFQLMTKPSGGCLLNFNKDSGKITIVKNGFTVESTKKVATIIVPQINIEPIIIDKLNI
jgi:putative phage-type endonuclease